MNPNSASKQARQNTTQTDASEADRSNRFLLAWDVAVVVLVIANLALIVFDSLFSITAFSGWLEGLWPSAFNTYNESIHQNFKSVDVWFVAIFVADVLLGWAVAIAGKRYARWWFYPFAHWYDVLGCIPLAGFRWLRVLRVIAIVIRLQRLGFIDIRTWGIYQFLMQYYGVLIEEISDRVVVNVLTGVQEEVQSGGSQLPQRIVTEVVQPRQDSLVATLSAKISHSTGAVYSENRERVHEYIKGLVSGAVHNNTAAKRIDRVPGLGDAIVEAIDKVISQTACDVIDEVVSSLSSKEFEQVLNELLDSLLDTVLTTETVGGDELGAVMVEVLELVKDQVKVQRWKMQLTDA